ncbi:MAG: STAS domain-containing protein [Candidatus Omnitrophica bacterium]|nr:hypothetical protein [bacterium]NUN95348.1 STAS domain-containing protein [Candidatus Omnitrophota bacterium]
MEFEIKTERGARIIEMSGALDMHASEEALRVLREAVRSAPNALLLDLSGLRYLKSSGYQVLFEVIEDSRKLAVPLAVVGAPEGIAEIMRVFRLEDLIPVYPSVHDALDGLLPVQT